VRIPTPADPLTAIAYVALLIAVTLLTMRRPAYGVAALIVCQPFALYGDVFDTTITLPKVALIGVLLGVASFPRAFAPLAFGTPWRLLIAGSLVVAATALSSVQAAHHAPVARESFKALEYVLLFAVIVAAYRLDPDRRIVRVAVLSVTIVVALLALAQGAIRAPSAFLMHGHLLPRVAGPLEGPNQLAGYFDVALPLVFALTVEEASALAIASLVLISFTDVLTFSRGGALGAAAGLVAVAWTLRHNLRAALLSVIGGLAGGFACSAFWGLAAHTLALAHFWDFSESPGGGVGSRPVLWRAAALLWRSHPWLGVGAGNFELEITQTGIRGVRTHANSLYLQSLVEGGIPLFASTVWLAYVSIASFARERLSSPFAAAAFAASIGLGVHQIIDLLVFYPKVGGWWWIVLGLGAAASLAPVRAAGAREWAEAS